MSICVGPLQYTPLCILAKAPAQIANDAFSNLAAWFGKAATSALVGLWGSITVATSIDLTSPHLQRDLTATAAIAVVLTFALFLIQVIASVLRREPGGLVRALNGMFVSLVGAVVALTVTQLLLAAVDQISAELVRYTMGTTLEGLGKRLNIGDVAGIANPAVVLLVSLVVLAAAAVIWASLMVRKVLIIVAAVLAPLAFSGATADLTRSWVRRWIEFMLAMVVSKLLLVIIIMVGVSTLEGAGMASTPTASQVVTQMASGALILSLAGFAPWIAIKMFSFAGNTLAAAHASVGQASTGGRAVLAAPQKMAAMATPMTRAVSGASSAGKAARSTPPKPPLQDSKATA